MNQAVSALTFNGVTLSPISHKNQTWLTSIELAKALGYADEKSVSRIYTRNKDEFAAGMTDIFQGGQFDHPRQNDVIGESKGLKAGTRIFSLRGCHLIAMFAKTVIAKEFRKWVLDILDKEINQKPYGLKIGVEKISPAQAQAIRHAVAKIAGKDKLSYQTTYWKLHEHFSVNSYLELNASDFDEAMMILGQPEQQKMVLISETELEQLRHDKQFDYVSFIDLVNKSNEAGYVMVNKHTLRAAFHFLESSIKQYI
ncbi:MAG: BRO family protein [Methylococcaceae bacterium]